MIAPLEKKDEMVFPTQIAMLQPVSYVCENDLKIKVFQEDGKPCYEGKSPSGHMWWDICDCDDCQEKEALKKIIQEGRKNLLSKYSKRDMK